MRDGQAGTPTAPVAQTNVQLYGQLRRAGWSEGDLIRLRGAYELATVLFSGALRPSGKTFVSHLVGTASVVASLGGRPDLVLAGLLHAAYAFGEWGDGSRRVTPRRREELRRVAGDGAEQLVAGYTDLPWNASALADLRSRADGLGPAERDLVLLRLANEVEDHLDEAMGYCGTPSDEMHRPARLGEMAGLADALGLAPLAVALRGAAAAAPAWAEVPSGLRRVARASASVPPRSHWRRPVPAARRLVGGLRRRLRREAR
ncbi:MAG: HD domain-containing protein [Acidimicrobiia bacterium]|nr:HD domain-containing protein [Acidimicrobiia bacterium]